MKKLDCCYKGGRTYIHATDMYSSMYNVFLEKFNEIPHTSKLSIRKMVKNQLVYTTTKITGKPVFSIFEAETQKSSLKYFLYEEHEKVDTRKEYDEGEIIENAQISPDGRGVMIKGYNRYSISEISVALLKELCNNTISNSAKWTCVEIKFSDKVPLYTIDSIKVTLDKNIGTKMVVSSILLNDRKIGGLKFSSK